MRALLTLKGVSVALAKRPVLDSVSLDVTPGAVVGLLGPNGCGKTTALRVAVGLLSPETGTAAVAGQPVQLLSPRDRARLLAYLPQTRAMVWPIPVEDAVALGRFAYGASPGDLRAEDRAAVERAIEMTGLEDLRRRRVTDLSGGELARVHMARVLAAQAPLFIADEPVTSLDPYYQLVMMDLIAQSVRAGQNDAQAAARGALVVLHDIALAARLCSRVVVMKAGRILADGAPREVLSPQILRDAYDIDAELQWYDGVPSLILRAHRLS